MRVGLLDGPSLRMSPVADHQYLLALQRYVGNTTNVGAVERGVLALLEGRAFLRRTTRHLQGERRVLPELGEELPCHPRLWVGVVTVLAHDEFAFVEPLGSHIPRHR